jgi:toxin ParE1/3/4
MNYVISQEANQDLKNIWLYTYESWSLKQADRYLNLLIHEIEYISSNPEPGKDYSQVRKGYFCSRMKSHLIFYKVNRKKKRIEVIRILHQMMDLESRLSE